VTGSGYHQRVYTRRPRGSAAIAALLAGALLAAAVPGVGATPRTLAEEISTPSAAALATLRSDLLRSVTADRDSAGLRSLREDPVLDAVAQARAERLAASSEFSHAAAGPAILSDVQATGIEPYRAGEALGWSAVPGTSGALDAIRRMWLASPPHRAILLTAADNYIGVGVATRGSRTFATIVVAETRDRTRPAVRLAAPSRDGTAVTFTWTATDPLLQTHTAGVRSVAVQLRVDEGPWRTLRAACTGSSIVLDDRASGHAYSVRVRARDRVGNVSEWTAVQTILVP
jgi:uncharacterized protein YkwD